MTAITFDTLAAAKRLREAGLDQKTAESVVAEIVAAQVELATRPDLLALEQRLKVSAAGYLYSALGLFIAAQVAILGAAKAYGVL